MAVEPIKPGREYVIREQADTAAMRLICTNVQQRNWSRVAKGQLSLPDGRTVDCFVKQYVGKDGLVHTDHWDYEREGVEYAVGILGSIARVPELLARDENLVLNIFEYYEIVSIDQLLRTNPEAFSRCIEAVLHRMEQTLAALQSAVATKDVSRLNTKQRNFGRQGLAVNFKGFEIRNAGVVKTVDREVTASDLVLFDFVRPYLAPIEEAAAKLFVSVGMLNWGSPISRFIQGPDDALLAKTAVILRPWLDKTAISAELHLQQKFRNSELKGERNLEVILKWLGVAIIGRYYFAKLRNWCAANI